MMKILIFVGATVFSFFHFAFSQISTTPLSPGGGEAAYQDIAILYDLSYSPIDNSLDTSKQIASSIYTTLFNGPAYRFYDDQGEIITRITPLAFPNTKNYNYFNGDNNYGYVKSQADLKFVIDQSHTNLANITYIGHPNTSKISDALEHLQKYIQQGRRAAPVSNTIVIISKSDADVAASLPYINSLNSTQAKVLNAKETKFMTIGVGNGSISQLASLSSGPGYNFVIPDITNLTQVQAVAQQIAQQLIHDDGVTLIPTTTVPTTPFTGTTTLFTGSTTTGPTTTPGTGTPLTTSTTSTTPGGPSNGTTPIPTTTSPSVNETTTTTAPPPTTTPTSTGTTTTKNQYNKNDSSINSINSIFFLLFFSCFYIFY